MWATDNVEKTPNLVALRADCIFPRAVRGPADLRLFARFAARCRVVTFFWVTLNSFLLTLFLGLENRGGRIFSPFLCPSAQSDAELWILVVTIPRILGAIWQEPLQLEQGITDFGSGSLRWDVPIKPTRLLWGGRGQRDANLRRSAYLG